MAQFFTNTLDSASSFLRGLASAFDFFGNYYNFNYSKDPKKADMQAIYLDFATISQDMWKAIYTVKKEMRISDKQLSLPLNYGSSKKTS